MIKANELRLGNLFLYNYKTDLISSVEWIQPDSVNITFERQPDLVNGVVCSPSDLMPIELTETLLSKLGFFDKGFGDFKKGQLRLSRESKNHFVTNGFMVEIQFIHQLQNLYFAVCGEELVFSSTEP